MKSIKFCGICLAQYNLLVIKSLIWFSSTKSIHKCSSSEWSVPSILVLYHIIIIHKPNLDSHSCGHNTHKCQRNKQTNKVSHSPVAETKHNPLTWIGCSGKLCIKKYNTVKLGAEHTCYYDAQRGMPERQGKDCLPPPHPSTDHTLIITATTTTQHFSTGFRYYVYAVSKSLTYTPMTRGAQTSTSEIQTTLSHIRRKAETTISQCFISCLFTWRWY